MARNALRDEIAALLEDLDVHDRSYAQKADILLDHYEMTARDQEAPF